MSTYTPVASQTLSASASSVTFSNIPQDYTDLVLVVNCKISTGDAPINMQYNNDTGSNYSFTYIYGNGTSAASGRASSQTNAIGGYADATNFNPNIIHIMNYSNSTTYKTSLSRRNTPAILTSADVSLWRNTSAINSIYLYPNSGSFASGSTFSLYGIQAGTPKAQGGQSVTTDGTYWYHTFTGSGTFTPSTALTADCLVVAGGGGGGRLGGGGGAGGFKALTSQSFSSGTAYSVIVGAGGTGSTNRANNGSNGSDSVLGSITSTGGGGGGSYATLTGAGSSGGSGGGAAGGGGTSANTSASVGGAASPSGQGNKGGDATMTANYAMAGGGGSSAAGGNAGQNASTAGGAGTANSYSGTSVTYAGGGGGGGDVNGGSAGSGGSGGGGAGSTSNSNATSGTANTGGGGGGSRDLNGNGGNGGSGGSGIIIIRYAV